MNTCSLMTEAEDEFCHPVVDTGIWDSIISCYKWLDACHLKDKS